MSRMRDFTTGMVVLVLSVGIVLAYGIVGALPTAQSLAPPSIEAPAAGADEG